MQHLLNLLAAIALLVWGTHMVRTGVLRVMGGKLRDALAEGMSHKGLGLLAGMGVSSALQSSTATCLIVSAFVGQGLLSTSAALVMMLGADVGTSLMAPADRRRGGDLCDQPKQRGWEMGARGYRAGAYDIGPAPDC